MNYGRAASGPSTEKAAFAGPFIWLGLGRKAISLP